MNRHLLATSVALTLSFGAAQAANAAQLAFSGPTSVTYYNGFVENPGVGIQFSNPFGTDTMTTVSELRDIGGSDSVPHWPNGSVLFGADFTGLLNATATGDYTVSFGTDDAGYLFIDGALAAAQPGLHGIGVGLYTAHLTAGDHSFEVQYDNGGGGGAVAEFRPGVPEPATWGLMLVGFGAIGAVLRRRQAAILQAAG